MHDSHKTVPTFLVYGAGLVFLIGLGWIWTIQPLAHSLSLILAPSTVISITAITSGITTLVAQWVLIQLWRRWNTPKTQSPEGEPIRLTPDKRERIQTGQGQ